MEPRETKCRHRRRARDQEQQERSGAPEAKARCFWACDAWRGPMYMSSPGRPRRGDTERIGRHTYRIALCADARLPHCEALLHDASHSPEARFICCPESASRLVSGSVRGRPHETGRRMGESGANAVEVVRGRSRCGPGTRSMPAVQLWNGRLSYVANNSNEMRLEDIH